MANEALRIVDDSHPMIIPITTNSCPGCFLRNTLYHFSKATRDPNVGFAPRKSVGLGSTVHFAHAPFTSTATITPTAASSLNIQLRRNLTFRRSRYIDSVTYHQQDTMGRLPSCGKASTISVLSTSSVSLSASYAESLCGDV